MSTTDTQAVPTAQDITTALIRTIVPYIVGWIVALLASISVTLDDGAVQSLNGLVTLVVGSLYYIVVRWLEEKWPSLGWLLGSAKQPTYVDKRTVPGEVVNEVEEEPALPDEEEIEDDAVITEVVDQAGE